MIGLGVGCALIAVWSLSMGVFCIVNPAKGFLMGRRWQFDGRMPQPSGCALTMTRVAGVVGVVSGLIFGLWAVVIFFGSS